MRHNKKFNHLGRKSAHRKAMLANMASSLIIHKRIETTVAKAKALRIYIEPLVTKTKKKETFSKDVEVKQADGTVKTVSRTVNTSGSTHAQRIVFSYLKDKQAVKELFGTIGPRVVDRPGGYVRILKTGFRKGDAAEMALVEFVDFNEAALTTKDAKEAKKTTRRSRRKSSTKAKTDEVKDVKEVKDQKE